MDTRISLTYILCADYALSGSKPWGVVLCAGDPALERSYVTLGFSSGCHHWQTLATISKE